MKNKFIIEKSAIIQYLLIYLAIISTRACIYVKYTNIVICFTIIVCTLLTLLYKRMVDKRLLIYMVLIVLSLLIVRYVSGGIGLLFIFSWISKIWCAYSAFLFMPKKFFQRVINLVMFLNITSLILWILCRFVPNIYTSIVFGQYKEVGMGNYYGFLLYSYRTYDSRNNGIFTEPGIYQLVLIVAIFIVLFLEHQLSMNQSKRQKVLFMLILGLITTQSTTGYMSLIFMFILYILLKKDILKNRILTIVTIISLFLLIDVYISGQSSLIYTNILNKIMNSNGKIDFSINTGIYRMNTLYSAWQVFLKHPLGAGIDIYSNEVFAYMKSHSLIATAGGGLVYILAVTGIITYIIVILLLFSQAFKNRVSNAAFIVLVFIFINTAISQNEIIYSSLIFISFMKKNVNLSHSSKSELDIRKLNS